MPPVTPATPACPVCGKPTVHDHRPFCSRGCRDRDLIGWLDERYRIPAPAIDPDGLDSEREAD